MSRYSSLIFSSIVAGLMLVTSCGKDPEPVPVDPEEPQEEVDVDDDSTVYESSGNKRYPIFAWYSLEPGHLKPESYRNMYDCGFDISYSQLLSIRDVKESLEAAKGTGVKLCCRLVSFSASQVQMIKDHEQLWGYYIGDEPSADQFAECKKNIDVVMAADPSHPCYLNLFPNYASEEQLGVSTYEEYIRRYISEVGTPYISYDNYPIVGSPGVMRPTFFKNLEIVSRLSKEAGIPFYAFTLSTIHLSYLTVTAGTMRFSAWCDLAFGAQMLEYYTYTTTPNDNFTSAILNKDYSRNVLYDHAKLLNAEIHGLSDVFVGCDVKRVGCIGANTEYDGLPSWSKNELPDHFKSISTSGQGVLISEFTNGDDRYVMLVNLDFDKTQDVSVSIVGTVTEFVADPSVKSHFKVRPAKEKRQIAPGDMALYKIG